MIIFIRNMLNVKICVIISFALMSALMCKRGKEIALLKRFIFLLKASALVSYWREVSKSSSKNVHAEHVGTCTVGTSWPNTFLISGWKSTVLTRMYEGKLKSLEEDREKKNKMLSDVKILLREAAEREQSLLREREELQRKVCSAS